MTQAYPCRLRNATGRPVELHRGAFVEVLVPGAILDLVGPDPVAEPLVARGDLTRHAMPAPHQKPAPPVAPDKTQQKSPTTKGTPRRVRMRNADSGGTR